MNESRPDPAENDRPASPSARQAPNPTKLPTTPTDGSAEAVECLRTRLADHDADAARLHTELVAELARQEAILAERLRREQVDAAEAAFTEIHSTYSELATVADAAFDELYSISCRAAIVFKAAVQAEHARREFMSTLESAWLELLTVSSDVAEPVIDPPRDFAFGPHDHRRGAAITGLLVYPEIKRQLAGLTDRTRPPQAGRTDERRVEPIPRTTDQLDVIFGRAQRKREHDDAEQHSYTA